VDVTHVRLAIGSAFGVEIAQDGSGAATAPRRRASRATAARPNLNLARVGHFSSSYLVPRGAGRAQGKRRRQSRLFRVGSTEKDCNEALQSESKGMRPLERSRRTGFPSLRGPSSASSGGLIELHGCHIAEGLLGVMRHSNAANNFLGKSEAP